MIDRCVLWLVITPISYSVQKIERRVAMAGSNEGEMAIPISSVTAQLLTGQSKSEATDLIDFEWVRGYCLQWIFNYFYAVQ